MTWLNWPNRITIIRILLIVPLVLCLLNINTWPGPVRYAALGLFVLIALADVADGQLARHFGLETQVGRFLDPLADKLVITCSVILLALPATAVPGARLPNWVPVLVIGKDVVITLGFSLLYATTGRAVIRPRVLGKACTVVQSVMIAAVLASPDLSTVLSPCLPVLYYVVAGLAVVAAVDYLIAGNRLARELQQEPPRG
jgi:CDP-diacylglycerol--glycerol-3-phosphate 3-phosphatidyltransferase